MIKKRGLRGILILASMLCVLTGCGKEETPGTQEEKNSGQYALSYDNEIPEGGIKDDDKYNHKLFYRNDLLQDIADPQMIYISDPDSSEYGYYYLYGTTSAAVGFEAYRSKDLYSWERLSSVMGHLAFEVQEGYAAGINFWAPEVIYDGESGQYYLFYSGTKAGEANGFTYLCLAVSENPYGPFLPCTENGLTEASFLLDVEKANGEVDEKDRGDWLGIDAHPFVGADGEKYLFFCRVADPGDRNYDSVWGMRMDSWSSPDYSTLTKLTSVGYLTVEQTEKTEYESATPRNEGPFVHIRRRDDGSAAYYLTTSINGTSDYAVIQAVSDKPLGPYTKLTEEEGGILLANDNMSWDHVRGPGHHCFIQAGEELYIIYHEQGDRQLGAGWDRYLAKDRVTFAVNGNGQEIMVVNGPTWSLQPQVEEIAEYRNIAGEAAVTATAGQHVEALTDGLLSIYKNVDFITEYETGETATVTLDFGEYREITGLMIYNSKWYEKAFVDVARVELDFRNEALPDGATAYIENLEFDWKSYKNANSDDMRPGGSAVAVFSPLEVKTIRITFECPVERPQELELIDAEGYIVDQTTVAVSEIAVLGK